MNTIVNITGLTLNCLGISEENVMLNKKLKNPSRKEYYKKYYLKNKEHKKQYAVLRRNKLKKFYKEKIKKEIREYHLRKKLFCKVIKQKTWFRKYEKEKRKNDPNFKIASNLRRRINNSLKQISKSKKTFDLLGCNIEQLWSHLEKSFKPGMTKQNYGDWHIDHIKPCASFDLTKLEEQSKCFHYTNLQALWAHENLSKGAKIL